MGLNGYDQTQQVNSDQGIRTQYGITLPPGARVAAYVRSTGIQSGDDTFLAYNLVATVAAGLARVRSGMGDFVICLPGHTETVADGTTFSNALVAGAKIIGVGRGGNTPVINFTLAAGQWLINKADVFIGGLKFNCNSGTPATAPFSLTAADFGFSFNEVIVSGGGGGSGTSNFFTINAGADRFDISSNVFRGGALTATTLANISAAISDCRFCDNEAVHGAPSATGHVFVGAACPGMKILRNFLNNTTAASVAALSWSNVASTGQCAYNTMTVLSTGAVSAGVTGITVGGTNNLTGYFQNFCVNDPNKSGLLVPAVDT